MAKVKVEGIEVEEEDLTPFQRLLIEKEKSSLPSGIIRHKTPSHIRIELRPIYEFDENYVYTGKSMGYYKDIERTTVNDNLFERWTPCTPMCAPSRRKVKIKDGEESKLNNLDNRVIFVYVEE